MRKNITPLEKYIRHGINFSMKLIPLLFTLGMVNILSICNAEDMLAPHPLYFTVDGSPAKESIEVDGKEYEVSWDGEKVGIREKPGYPWPWRSGTKETDKLEIISEFFLKVLMVSFPFMLGLWLWSLILLPFISIKIFWISLGVGIPFFSYLMYLIYKFSDYLGRK